jgi:hypothetical protein
MLWAGEQSFVPTRNQTAEFFRCLDQRFSMRGRHTLWGYAMRAQKSLDLVTKSLSWLITQENVYNFIRFVNLFMSFFVYQYM